MGLFGGGNSASSVTTVNDTTNTDARQGASENGIINNGGAITITNSDAAAVAATAGALGNVSDVLTNISADNRNVLTTISGDNASTARTVLNTSVDLLQQARLLGEASIAESARSSRAAIDAAEAAGRAVAQNASDNLHSSLSFAGDTQNRVFDAVGDLTTSLDGQSRTNRDFATGLVESVLKSSQSEDAKNYQETLGALIKIGALIAAAVVAAVVFGKK